MARQSFRERYPYAGLFLVIAITLAIPLTVWSLNNVSTQYQQHAAAIPTPTPISTSCSNSNPSGYCPTGQNCTYIYPAGYVCLYAPTPTPKPLAPTPTPKPLAPTPTPAPSTSCLSAPTWSGLLGHTDGATSVKYKYSLKNNCAKGSNFYLTATRPTSGWSYQYSGCSINTSCTYFISAQSSTTIYVTIARPSSASKGTYYVSLKAAVATNTSIYSTKKVSYIVQ